MYQTGRLREIDYLVVGHITRDETPDGPMIGGPALYCALTAVALGHQVGIVTSWAEDLDFPKNENLHIHNIPNEKSTVFRNIYSESGRTQYIQSVAANLEYYMIPEIWRTAPMVHLAPVANEILPDMLRYFRDSFVGISLQGWLRGWEEGGRVIPQEWPESTLFLPRADAVVLSNEDVGDDWEQIYRISASVPVLAVTRNKSGAVLLYQGKKEEITGLDIDEVDATGAGDVFAATFFHWLKVYGDPLSAAKFANRIAAFSVQRKGIASIPDKNELFDLMQEVV